ncbi:MAG: DUF2330 domain-containing protein [Candidatus Tectomicrobia bacterium]
MHTLRKFTGTFFLSVVLIGLMAVVHTAHAFCGFYVAKADTKLFNTASKVVMVRHSNKTVITMANDYQGDPQEFALVIPVPTVLDQDQIHVTEPALIDHLDAYTAPRLVEYFDHDPCQVVLMSAVTRSVAVQEGAAKRRSDATALGVTIEAEYTVGEYDILILSAQESTGLETWLIRNGYKIPQGASPVIASYLRQGMKFFVAKVNLKEHASRATTYLHPLQIAFESDHFMLPIRLGTLNAAGPQELFIFILSRHGRVETANYRTRKLPSNIEIPLFVKNEFGKFYQAMFAQQVQQDRMQTVFVEYAWDMGWCDPCAADPLSVDELRELGVFWQGTIANKGPKSRARDVFVTRLHVRYTADNFPEDLQFREKNDRTNFQGRYILRHPWSGDRAKCQAAEQYFASLPQRFEAEAQNLARLTGWDIHAIRDKMGAKGQPVKIESGSEEEWYRKLWKR